ILAQAALETGWGKHEIPTADGGNSHNLFGIKAGSRWRGETTDITTTEYVNGRPIKQVDRFRVYDSFEDAFTDYARLIGDNPRYAGVVAAPDAASAARALQTAGYATDPAYADKLIAVMTSFGDGANRTVAQTGQMAAANGFDVTRAPTSIF
ncbi:glucosaminidase domain-containing protein, partial [Halomonas sp. BBD48]|nr:glucosaminidase domain-containing protein [Halomonas sp. BBD48]